MSLSIDDNDPSVIYSNGWNLITQDGPWTGTMHSTSVNGSFARVRFTGSRAAIICTIPTGTGITVSQAAFKVDDGQVAIVSHPANGPVRYETVFWDTGLLPMGSHLISMFNMGTTYFRFDRLDYDPTDGSTSNPGAPLPATVAGQPQTTSVPAVPSVDPHTIFSPPASSASRSNQPTHDSTTSVQTVLSTTTDSSSTQTGLTANNVPSTVGASKSSSSTVPLVAGILGGLLGLVLLIILFFFIRQRRKRAARNRSSIPPSRFSGLVLPRSSSPEELPAYPEMSSSHLVPVNWQEKTPLPVSMGYGFSNIRPQDARTVRSAASTESMYTSNQA